jgi:uncharacterized protein
MRRIVSVMRQFGAHPTQGHDDRTPPVRLRPAVEPGLREKVADLARPQAYPEPTATVEVVETHMAFVFLTDRHAYKLKKPVRYPFLDFSTPQARRADCGEEVRLNRRLAPDVYLGVVPLKASAGGMHPGGRGRTVDWLVKMVRLPRTQMLDQMLRAGRLAEADVERVTRLLARFYVEAEPVDVDPADYVARFRSAAAGDPQVLADPRYGLDRALLEAVAAAQCAFLERSAALLAERAARKLIVEGHGDLRPEHVCVRTDPVVIDCLEFDRELRLVDPVDELGYLAMECEFLGAPFVRDVVFDTYRSVTGDEPAPELTRFYQVQRALLRAKLAAWHVHDDVPQDAHRKWLARGADYLALAHRIGSAADATGSPRPVKQQG